MVFLTPLCDVSSKDGFVRCFQAEVSPYLRQKDLSDGGFCCLMDSIIFPVKNPLPNYEWSLSILGALRYLTYIPSFLPQTFQCGICLLFLNEFSLFRSGDWIFWHHQRICYTLILLCLRLGDNCYDEIVVLMSFSGISGSQSFSSLHMSLTPPMLPSMMSNTGLCITISSVNVGSPPRRW